MYRQESAPFRSSVLCVLTTIYRTQIKIQNSSVIPNIPRRLSVISLLTWCPILATSDLSLVPEVMPFPENVALWVSLLFLSDWSRSFICVAQVKSVFLSRAHEGSAIWIDHSLFICFFVDGHVSPGFDPYEYSYSHTDFCVNLSFHLSWVYN